MNQYQSFVFRSYTFDESSKSLTLTYGYDEALTFTETYHFNFAFTSYDPEALDRACQLLFFIAGVSYYKAFLAPTIEIKAGQIDESLAQFLSNTYQKGLGEFFYVNQLDPRTTITFPTTTDQILNMLSVNGQGSMVAVGGGKDSLVSIELLRGSQDVTTWSVDHHAQLQPLVDRIGLPHLWIERQWDPLLLELNDRGAYNGHVPISAIFACVGVVAAILSGKRDVVMSNEQSANEPTLHYHGLDINHQYSKSSLFETDFQTILQQNFGDSIRYYSLLRPYSELRISELFSRSAFEKYKNVFSSCNRAFTHNSDRMFWCGICPKCAFVFLALTPFIERSELETIWGKNLLLDESLEPHYRRLLGIEGDKPLECVGEIKESRVAMRLAFSIYPELNKKYLFEIPSDYDFRAQGNHTIPSDVFDRVLKNENV